MPEHLNTKKQNGFVKAFIPNKYDSKGAVIRKIIVVVCLIVFIGCSVYVISDFTTRNEDEQIIDNIKNTVQLNASGTFSASKEKIETIKEEVPQILDKFVDIYAENSDVVGWLKLGHYIDYPVLMNKDDDDFYLYRNFKKEDSKSGSIFCDNHIQPISGANNLVIYGHNMASGEYFGQLTHYNPNTPKGADKFIEYYKQYPTIQFDTLYEEGTYKIFAGIYINTEEKDGYPYPYYRKRKFNNEYEFMDFMGNIMDRSLFYTDVDVEYGDQIITLSTCYWFPLGKTVDTRFALFARKVREGESAEVDVDKITVNPSPLYFDEYYKRTGAVWEGRRWDLSLVKDFDKYTDKIDSRDELEPAEVTAAATE